MPCINFLQHMINTLLLKAIKNVWSVTVFIAAVCNIIYQFMMALKTTKDLQKLEKNRFQPFLWELNKFLLLTASWTLLVWNILWCIMTIGWVHYNVLTIFIIQRKQCTMITSNLKWFLTLARYLQLFKLISNKLHLSCFTPLAS